jgi:hypothetical protein
MNLDDHPESPILETLEHHVGSLARAVRPAEVFRQLLEATRPFTPRSAVFLAREQYWKGWGASGYGRDAAERVRQVRIGMADSPLDQLAQPDGDVGVVSWPGDVLPEFGQPEAAETLGVPLRAGTRTIGLLVAQRGPGEEPWFPAALGILATAARLRLELDLTLRRLQPTEKTPAPERPSAAAAPPESPTPEVATTTAPPAETSVTPWVEPAPEPPDSLRRQEARRFARLVATDIRLYNEEAVVLGRRNRDLFRRLEEQIDRGRQVFEHRFPDLGAPGRAFLHEAYVEILAGGDADLLPMPVTDERSPGTAPEP